MSSEKLMMRRAGSLRGSVRVPGDKSISHRALLLGAIADGPSLVQGFLRSEDCLATLQVVRSLGVEVAEREDGVLVVHGRGLNGLQEPTDILDCRRSGTTMRLLAGILAGQPFVSILSGEEQLRRRPMARIIQPLGQMGATVLGRKGGRYPPITMLGGRLRGMEYTLPVASAQVKSALLLAGLYAAGPTTLHVPGPARDHTERMLGAMGCDLLVQGSDARVSPAERLSPVDIRVPGDVSSAAFLMVAATLVPGSEVTIEGVGVNQTRTGLLETLFEMGADIRLLNTRKESGEPVADLAVRAAELCGVEVSGELVVRGIDEFPVLAVAATQARGETIVRDAAELRVKETDRIATTVQELRRLGAGIDERPDGFVVHGPTPLRGCEVGSHGDHRLAMALSIAGLVADGTTTVRNVACIDDSYPGFEDALTLLGSGAL